MYTGFGTELHPLIKAVRDENAVAFVPMLQRHWTTEYANACRRNDRAKTALQDSLVLCRNGAKCKLRDCWFPTKMTIKNVRYWKGLNDLNILQLPDSEDGCETSTWPCLQELGIQIRDNSKLKFFKAVLLALSAKPDHGNSRSAFEELYRILGDLAKLSDETELKV